MKKKEILKHYKSSLEKWEEVLDNIKRKNEFDYFITFWNVCGFCKVYSDMRGNCGVCPLLKKMRSGWSYCEDYNDSCASEILFLADNKKWPKAEKLCKQFIAKIKREIKKVENK